MKRNWRAGIRRTFGEFFRGKSERAVKYGLSGLAVLLGFGAILGTVYGIIPGVLGEATEMLEQDIAVEMYEKTLQTPIAAPPTSTAEAVFEQPAPKLNRPLFVRDEFASVLADNPDIVGRFSAPDITYLVTQTTDNKYYLTHGYDRQESRSGTIYLDYRCNIAMHELSGHYILYGHHMKNGTMFAPLVNYKDEAFFRQNRIIHFDTLYANHKWEVFSAYVTDTDFYFIETIFADGKEWLDFLHTIHDKSIFDTNITLTSEDVVLTLCTCTYEFEDARFVVHARLIKD